jgi:hypothetical protein
MLDLFTGRVSCGGFLRCLLRLIRHLLALLSASLSASMCHLQSALHRINQGNDSNDAIEWGVVPLVRLFCQLAVRNDVHIVAPREPSIFVLQHGFLHLQHDQEVDLVDMLAVLLMRVVSAH